METIEEKLVTTYPNDKEHERDNCVWADHCDAYILKEEAYQCEESGSWYHEDDVNEYMIYCYDIDAHVENDYAWYCQVAQEWYYNTGDRGELYDGGYVHMGDTGDYVYIEYGQADGHYLHRDDAAWCYDIQDYVHEDDAHWCEADDEYYYDEDKMPSREDDEHICSYHESPEAEFILDSYYSKMRIGFEIEKTAFKSFDGGLANDRGDYVGSHELLKGYETDSSCGVEAITNILPLDSPRSEGRNGVFEYFDEAECIINSPSNKRCGGHICISVQEMSGYDILNKVRGNMAILYAMYRYRLNKEHCRNNKKLNYNDNTKYSPVNVKPFGIEIRIPSAVKNVRQLKLRYDLIYKIMHHSIRTRQSYDKLLEKIDYILMRMYKNREKVDNVKRLSYDFRKYLLNDEYPNTIREFLETTEDEIF